MKFFKQLITIILCVLMLAGCKNRINKEISADKFFISDSLMKMIEIDSVKLSKVINDIKLIGKVTFNGEKVVKIFPLVSGLVINVNVELGDMVTRGQTLAVMKSSEIGNIENDLTTAQSNLAVAKSNLSATEGMYKGGIASEKEYIASQKEVIKAESELKRVNNIIGIYGAASDTFYVVKSPVSGYIVEKFITANMQLRADNSTNLFTISDLKNIWILANVYESDIASIKEGQGVSITTISYPDKIFKGNIDKIYNVLDPDNKTMKVRIQLDNKENLLKPEMFANVIVHQINDSTMLSVPAKSIVFDRNKYWVIVYKDRNNVEIRQVDLVMPVSSNSYIRSGLKSGEKVITKNQLLIYNALNQ
jgi:cobalt-zinc-cadmium efflux system membrane fusion protein